MTGVNKQTSNVDACIKYFEMVNTDKQLYNLLCYGIEGTHWVWVDKDKKIMGFPEGVTAETSTYNPNTDWMFGNQFNAYYRDAAQVGAWEATKKMNDTAYPSKALGFVIDREPIKTEIAQVTAILKEKGVSIDNGFEAYDDAAPALIDQINKAGAEKIITEVQRQIDEWAAKKTQTK